MSHLPLGQPARPTLRKELGLVALVAYGVGDILGAGIYALVGKIAGIAGPASWFAFGIALAVAALSALSYAELGRRFPRSGGEAYFCQQAFGWPSFALLIGWLVFCSGIVSLATVSHAFAGHLLDLFGGAAPAAKVAWITVFLAAVAGINFWGIRQSSTTNIVCTVVETSGLLLVIVVGLACLVGGDRRAVPLEESTVAAWPSWIVISQAAALAFFAFIGFEDMVNVAEEVRMPERNLPLGIMLALIIAGSIYVIVVWVATAVVPASDLAASPAPLLEVVRRAAPIIPPWSFATIALFAVANTGLLNCIMASRLLYGMAQQGLVPSWLGAVHSVARTPHWSIAVVMLTATLVALLGSLVDLAGTTSGLLLLVFCSVNTAFAVILWRDPGRRLSRLVSLIMALVAALSSVGLIGFLPWASLRAAAILLVLGILFVVAQRLKRNTVCDS